MTDLILHNRHAWDRQAALGNPATIPVDDAALVAAAAGNLVLSLTGQRPLPAAWCGDLRGRRVLGVALGGGQQVPLLAATGAQVTSFDNSPSQLEADRLTAKRHGLAVDTVLGNMQDMAALPTASFDLVLLGLGLQFIADPAPVWTELARVVKPGGRFVGAVVNPVHYAFKWPQYDEGILEVGHALPYSDLASLTPDERLQRFDPNDPIEFGHTLEQILGGLIGAGFAITGFFEDTALDDPMATYIANYFVVGAVLG